MKILALDTSQLQAAVALLDGDAPALRVAASAVGSTSVSHSESILPLIDQVLGCTLAGKKVAELDAFAVGVGPGSFTGVRIGCATIKALAQATSKPVIPFSSLKALVFSAAERIDVGLAALVNAYQGLVFTGAIEAPFKGAAEWREQAIAAADFSRARFSANGAPREATLCGSGAHLYWSKIEEIARETGVRASLSDVQWATPEGVARAVAEELGRGKPALKRYSEITANYLRASQAEIKLNGEDGHGKSDA
ncbi:MAG: tRNA (adenosine(37)-N6)-threonylcarbamoyltransferase complex dimerization subunit type 1 TsaB [Deltaproteobacteria bacterium]|nr:tRNA (adenosine(37)-N6)-threonylcarbamoyltransferase complex dimerization subunit type 1 TsaB [Deltaproteobacteria bacterium]